MAERRILNPFARKHKPAHRYAAHQISIPAVSESVKALSARLDDWQAKVLRYAELIPEVMTGYSFVHNTMDMVTFEIQRFDRHENEWLADDTAEIQGIERRLNLAFKAGRAAALGHLVEEAFVLVTRTADNGFCFETLGPTEIKSKGKLVERRVLKDGEKDVWITIGHDTTIIRIYTPDPSDRNRASGPHKPLLGLLETMALELSRDQADAISVLAGNGILYIPTEILPDESDTLDASDTPGSRKGFENALEEAMIATIADRARGDAIVPITLYGPAEYAKDIVHILPSRPEGADESGRRMQNYIERYARSIDLPAQVILGIGDANHWGDWKVDENTWAYHLYPRGQRIADAIYDGLIRKILVNLCLDPCEYRLVPNAASAIAKSDMSRSAAEAYKVGAIKVEAYVEAIGFQPSDIRDDADELLLALISQDPAVDAALLNQNAPDRTAAASTNPATILRQSSRVVNSQQAKMHKLYLRILSRIADDAAQAGRLAAKRAAKSDKTAAGEIPFEGYDPAAYFDKYRDDLEHGTIDQLFATLRRIATLTGIDYNQLRSIWRNEFQGRALAVSKQAEEIANQVSERSFKSGKPARVADNVVRTLTSTANGGSNQSNGEAGNTARPTHVGEDAAVKDTLKEAVGAYATQYTWVVGHPNQPFPPHQALDGRTWFSWQEFDELDSEVSNPWLPGVVYFPGDHNGCQCEYEIDFVPITTAQESQ